jgi:hypothetical protein
MTMTDNLHHVDSWDQATAARLARLRDVPIDTTVLHKALRSEMRWQSTVLRLWIRPLRVAAGLLLVAGLSAILLMTLNHAPSASAAELAKVHADLVAGRTPAVEVHSIEEARNVLLATATDGPELPAMPPGKILPCCVSHVANKQISCVLMKDGDGGAYITMAVAPAGSVRMGGSETIRGGQAFRHQQINGLNMVTMERGGRHVCLMSELPAEKLMDLAGKLEF